MASFNVTNYSNPIPAQIAAFVPSFTQEPLPSPSEAAKVIDGVKGMIPSLTGHDPAAIKLKTQIQLRILVDMLADLQLPSHTDSMLLKDVMLCNLIDLFHQIYQKKPFNPVEVDGIQIFINHAFKYPFDHENSDRLESLLTFLKRGDPIFKQLLEEPEVKTKIRVLKFLLNCVDFERLTLAELKFMEDEAIGDVSSYCLQDSRYLLKHIDKLLHFTFDLMDREMEAMYTQFEPTQNKRSLMHQFPRRERVKMPHLVQAYIASIETFHSKMGRLIALYKARRDLLIEQFDNMQELLEYPTSTSLFRLELSIHQVLKTIHLLQGQLSSFRKYVYDESYQISLNLPELTVESINIENERFVIKEIDIKKSFFETVALTSDSIIQRHDALEACDLMMGQVKALTAMSKMLTAFNSMTSKIQQGSEKEREKNLNQIADAVARKVLTSSQAEMIFRTFEDNYRKSHQLVKVLETLEHSVESLNDLVLTLQMAAKQIRADDQAAKSTPFDILFVEEPCPIKRKPKPPEAAAITNTAPPPPVLRSITPPSTPLEKVTLTAHLRSVERLVRSQFVGTQESRLAAQHAAMYIDYLGMSLKLLKRCMLSDQKHLFPLFSVAFARYLSLISEQQLTARLYTTDIEARATHNHLELAQNLGLDDRERLQHLADINQLVISHRYPYSSMHYLRTHDRLVPRALKWILEPQTCSPIQLIQLADETLRHLRKDLSDSPEGVFNFNSSGKIKRAPYTHSYSQTFKEAFLELRPLLSRNIEQAKQKQNEEERGDSLDPLQKAIWKDVETHLTSINLCLTCLSAFPQTDTLPVLVDLLLTHLQYLDERMEEGLHLHQQEQILSIHDLQRYRALRGHKELPEHQQTVEDLNIGFGAQYPLRYPHSEPLPAAIECRKIALNFAKQASRIEGEVSDSKAGFKTVGKTGKATPVKKHPLLDLHATLIRLTRGVLEMSEHKFKLLHPSFKKFTTEK